LRITPALGHTCQSRRRSGQPAPILDSAAALRRLFVTRLPLLRSITRRWSFSTTSFSTPTGRSCSSGRTLFQTVCGSPRRSMSHASSVSPVDAAYAISVQVTANNAWTAAPPALRYARPHDARHRGLTRQEARSVLCQTLCRARNFRTAARVIPAIFHRGKGTPWL
jgi:hypothetical protein